MNVRLLLFASLLFLCSVGQAQEVSTVLTKPGARFEALTWGDNGRIYVVDFVSGEIFKIDLEGNWERIGPLFSTPLGGAMDENHNFYFSEFGTGNIIKFKPDDTHEVYCKGLEGPAGILIDDKNQLMYIANYNGDKLSKVDMSVASPSPETFAISPIFQGPDGLCFSPEGDLVSANFDDNYINKVSPAGVISQFTRVGDSPNTGYIVTNGEAYYCTGGNSHNIYHVELSGKVSTFSGTGSSGHSDGDVATARFAVPNGIAISPTGDTLIIAESTTVGRIRMITNLQGTTSTSSISSPTITISPNPVSDFFHIEFTLAERSVVEIELLDVKGAIIDTILPAQKYDGLIDLDYQRKENLPSGIYIVNIKIGQENLSRRVVVK